jgi:putative MATE family efflux protein
MNDAQIYFRITALSYPFLGVYNGCAALYRSMGNSKISMITSLIMNTINIVGNAICVFGLKMGVAGVAFPTLVSRVVAASMMLVLIQNHRNSIRVSSVRDLVPDFRMIKNILSVGVPAGLENGMFQFGKISLQSLISSLGTASIASYAVAYNLATLLYLPGNALGLGLVTIVGQCVGAGRVKEAKQYTKGLLCVNYAILAVFSTAIYFGAENMVGIYNLSEQAAVIACQMIRAHSIAMIIWPVAFLLPHALRASLDAKFTMSVSVFSMWVFRIGFAYLFVKVFHVGVIGVWYGMFIDWIFRMILFLWRFTGFEKRAVSVK